MEGQDRTAANTGKLYNNIDIMVDYSFGNKESSMFFVVLFYFGVKQIYSLICVNFCVCAGVFGCRGEGQKHQPSPRTGVQHRRAKKCCR